MYQSVVINHSIVTLENIDKFVDGASVARVGDITFDIAKDKVDDYVQVDEGAVCSTILICTLNKRLLLNQLVL